MPDEESSRLPVDELINRALLITGGMLVPSHLSAADFKNPYLALEKFARCLSDYEWDDILYDLLEFALGKGTIDGCYTSDELRQIRIRLMQLVEAAYLIADRMKR